MFYSKTSHNCLFCDTLCPTSDTGRCTTTSCETNTTADLKDNCDCHKNPSAIFGQWASGWEDDDHNRFHQRLEYLFVLKVLLEYPTSKCNKYMKNLIRSQEYDEKDGWFSVCKECEKLVQEGHGIFHKIEELEERMSELKSNLKHCIVSSERVKSSNDNTPTDDIHTEVIHYFSKEIEVVVKTEIDSDVEPNKDDLLAEIPYDNVESVGDKNDEKDADDNDEYEDANEDDERKAFINESDWVPSSPGSEMNYQEDPLVEDDSAQFCSKRDTETNILRVNSDPITDTDISDDDEQKSDDASSSSDLWKSKKKRTKGSTNLSCKICHTVYKTAHRLKEHMQLHNIDDAVSCNKCKFVCQTSRALLIHTNKTHTNTLEMESRKRKSEPTKMSKNFLNKKKSKESQLKQIKSDSSDENEDRYEYKCQTCPASYKKVAAFNSHVILHDCLNAVKCSECAYVSQTNKYMKRHVTKYHPSLKKTNISEPLECSKCPAKYYTEHRYKEHILLHGDPSSFTCTLCGWALPTESNLRHHEAKNHNIKKLSGSSTKRVRVNEGPFACDHCPAVYGTKHRFKDHVRINHKDKLLQCKECEKCFESAQLLELHVNKKRCPGKVEGDGKQSFLCQQCSSSFRSKAKLILHVAEIHVREKFPCELCPAVYPIESRLKFHMSREHNKARNICTVCGYKAHGASHLRLHMQKHTREKMYMCEICSKTFTSPTYLTGHKQKEHFEELGVKPIKCDQCDMLLTSNAQLKYHMKKTHEKDFRFYCDVCGKGFLFESNMKCHMKVHSTERNEVCEICGAAYVHNRVLLDHMKHHHPESYTAATGKTANVSKTNTREGPYICKFCDKEFAMRYHLHIHLQSHTEVYNKYKCTLCDKAYSSLSGLKRHEDSVHVSNSFTCEGCSKIFRSKDNLRYHQRNHCKEFVKTDKVEALMDFSDEEEIDPDPFVVSKGGSVQLFTSGQLPSTSKSMTLASSSTFGFTP